MIKPSKEEARLLAGHVTLLPVAREVFSDLTTSIRVLNNLRAKEKNCYLLESVATNENWGRYSFLGYAPEFILRGRAGQVVLEGDGRREEFHGDPVQALKELAACYKSPSFAWLPPFAGGFVGYFSYDFAGLPFKVGEAEAFDRFCLMKIDKVIVFDHFRQKIILICNIDISDPDFFEENYAKGSATLDELEALVFAELPTDAVKPGICGTFSERFGKEQYSQMSQVLRQYITKGEIFLANLSNSFNAPFDGSLLHTYRILRTANPSPYMVYMRLNELEIACASPETLVSVRDGQLSAYPLSGVENLAEHDILVDAIRDDLGKVSRFGSVKVAEYKRVKRFSSPARLVSQVNGRLTDACDALDALFAILPAGALCGVPRRRAAEIIRELEGRRRCLYGGALGYLAFTGNMDMCLGLNMAVLKNGRVCVQAGSNFSVHSAPEQGYEETKNKARVLIRALRGEEAEYDTDY